MTAQLRVPPHSIEAESSLLGGLLLSGDAFELVSDLLKPADFYRHEHRLVYEAIEKLCAAGHPADVVTVYGLLEKRGLEEQVGGLVYLNSLAQFVPNAANIRRYAEMVRERSTLRSLAAAGDKITSSAFNTSSASAKDLLDEAEQLIFKIGESERTDQGFTGVHSLVVDLLDEVQRRADSPDELVGLSTGYYDLDKMTSGLQAGDLIVLAARPSMGKTALAINIAENAALNAGLPVAVFSMEMSKSQITTRIVGSIGRIDQMHLRNGRLTDLEWTNLTEAVEKLRNVTLEIDDKSGLGIGELRTSARRLARKLGGLKLIVVDYLQLMSGSGSDENRATELGEISRGLKMLAKELQCPVLALSQLSRGVESRGDKRPLMSDLRESGAIEQDADIVMFIYRDDYYNAQSNEPGVAEIIISKQRNGPTGTCKLAFNKPITRFENLAKTWG